MDKEKGTNIEALISDKRFKEINEKCEQMYKRAEEFCQTRTNFQIEKFIACDEYTPITKFRHVAQNSFVALQEVRKMLIQIKLYKEGILPYEKLLESYQGWQAYAKWANTYKLREKISAEIKLIIYEKEQKEVIS